MKKQKVYAILMSNIHLKLRCMSIKFKMYVIQDTQGNVLASLSQALPQLHSPLEIEARAASSALQLAAELGFNQVVLEGDSQVLMHALAEDTPFLSTVGLLIDDVRFNAALFTKLHYSYVKREGNMVAHSLTCYALTISNFVVWMEDVSPPIVSVVLSDIASLP